VGFLCGFFVFFWMVFLGGFFWAGFYCQPWPQGSGLGTSSILAGAVVAACWTAAAAPYTRSDLVHAVLVVEQLLTTGGGWQDQVGGLHPGLSLGTSRPDRQVVVTTQHWDASEEFLAALG
jgi:fucokinase